MSAIQIPSPPAFVVKWACRRCGHDGGVARTTLPIVDQSWNVAMMTNLFEALRLKLVKIHMRGQGCIASPDDFIVTRATEDDAKIVGLI